MEECELQKKKGSYKKAFDFHVIRHTLVFIVVTLLFIVEWQSARSLCHESCFASQKSIIHKLIQTLITEARKLTRFFLTTDKIDAKKC